MNRFLRSNTALQNASSESTRFNPGMRPTSGPPRQPEVGFLEHPVLAGSVNPTARRSYPTTRRPNEQFPVCIENDRRSVNLTSGRVVAYPELGPKGKH